MRHEKKEHTPFFNDLGDLGLQTTRDRAQRPFTKVQRLMRTPLVQVHPDQSISCAARLMREHDVGMLPVVQERLIVGVITDRDIAVRFVTSHQATVDAPVGMFMSTNVICCLETDTVEHAAILMCDNQIRGLPVQNAYGCLVGVLTLCDLARDYSEQLAGETLGEIVEKR